MPGPGVEHFAHAGASLRPFIADDDHIAGVDLLGIDCGNGFLFGVEHARGTLMAHHLRGHGGLFHNAAILRKVALEHRDTAAFRIRLINGADDRRIAVFRRVYGFTKRVPRYGHNAKIQ